VVVWSAIAFSAEGSPDRRATFYYGAGKGKIWYPCDQPELHGKPSHRHFCRASSQLPPHPDTLLLEQIVSSAAAGKNADPEAGFLEPIPETRYGDSWLAERT
jgi:hypothetical protein